MKKQTADAKGAWQSAQKEVERLAKSIYQGGEANKENIRQMNLAVDQSKKLKAAWYAEQTALNKSREALRKAGIDTAKLA